MSSRNTAVNILDLIFQVFSKVPRAEARSSALIIFVALKMQKTIEQYRQAIQSGQINPVVQWDGLSSGSVIDPARDDVPLNFLSFGAYCLSKEPFQINTAENEYVLIPICGTFELSVGQSTFKGSRAGGPFATRPADGNASAIYIGRDSSFTLVGQGEMVYFAGPAQDDKPPRHIPAGSKPNLSRGYGLWRRDVITLATPQEETSTLVVGETYSPPGLWSGTPLHIHDKDDLDHGQSDHEEIYYHLSRLAEGKWGAYSVQLMFDDKGLDRAFMVHNRTAVAIPGAAHPVVAGPVSDIAYLFGLAGTSRELNMWDIPEFAYLKRLEPIMRDLDAARTPARISASQLNEFAVKAKLNEHGKLMLTFHLRERGYDVELP